MRRAEARDRGSRGRLVLLWGAALLPGLTASAQDSAAAASIDVAIGERLAEQWQLEQARALAETWLTDAPEEPATLEFAGRVQHMRGEHASALSLFEAAARISGRTRPTELQQRAWWSAHYAASFETLRTPHFAIRYVNKDEIVAHYAQNVLEGAYDGIGKALDFFPAQGSERIVVEIYPDARGLAGATGLTEKEIETSGTIAVCKFHRLMIISPLATANGYGWADTLAHEFTHLVISKKSRNSIPIWLHEGIAKFYESAWTTRPGESLSPYGEKLLAAATRKGELIAYSQMHPSMAKLPSQEDAALAFAEVFTTVEFLTREFGAGAIPSVLTLAGEGVELEAALQRVFSMTLGQVEGRWRDYLKKRPFREVAGARPRLIELASGEPGTPHEQPLEKIEEREVHDLARLGELLQLRGHHDAAVTEYERAYQRAGVQYASIVNRLARAYVQTGRDSDALGVLGETLRVHGDDADAHLLAGRLELKQDRRDAALLHFAAVRLQNPFNPEIHVALARLYEADGEEQAAALERRFVELSSQPRPTRDYRLPEVAPGDAAVSFVTVPWGAVRVDGGVPAQAPIFDMAMTAGPHSVEYLRADGSVALQDFILKHGERHTLVLR